MVGFVGFGKSNRAVYEKMRNGKDRFIVHNPKEIPLPKDCIGVFGENYEKCNEPLVFRSPAVRPDAIVTDGKITQEIELTFSLLQGKKIGVTGSDGKTTTCTLIAKMLEREIKTFLGGNIGVSLLPIVEQTNEKTATVLELSSFQLTDFCPTLDVAVVTNVTENHLNWHKNMDEYIDAKKNIVKKAKTVVLNGDDKIVRSFCDRAKTFSLQDENADAYCDGKTIFLHGKKFFKVKKIALLGKYNLKNVMASLLAVEGLISEKSMKKVLSTFSGVAHRCERVLKIHGVSYYDSSIDTTPSRTLATLSGFEPSRTILLLGGQDKNCDYSCLYPVAKDLKAVFVCGENRQKIAKSLDGCAIFITKSLKESILGAKKLAKRKDAVLLSPSSCSFDAFENYQQRGAYFSKIVGEKR